MTLLTPCRTVNDISDLFLLQQTLHGKVFSVLLGKQVADAFEEM